jgi:MFS family permease
VLATCFTLNMFGRGLGDTYAVFLLPLERDLGWSRSELTSVYSVYLLVNGLTAPLVGALFDRLGPRWVYGASLLSLGAAMLLAGGLTQLWQFYLFIGVMVGVGVSLNGMVPASALLSRWYRERLSTAMGIAYSAFGAGTVLFVPLVQFLVGEYGWRSTYRVLGWTLLALAPVVVLALPWKTFAAGAERQAAPQKAGEGWTLRAALRSRVFWGLVQVFFCTASGVFSIVVQLIAFFVDAGFTPLAAATAFGVVGLCSAMSVMGSGFAADRFGYRQTITASFAGTLSGLAVLLAMTFRPSWLLLVLFVPLYGFCMGVRGPIVSSVAARYFAGPRVATIYGVIYASNAVGAAVGSLAGGLLHDLTGGYRAALAMAIVLMTLAALPFWSVPTLRDFRQAGR